MLKYYGTGPNNKVKVSVKYVIALSYMSRLYKMTLSSEGN